MSWLQKKLNGDEGDAAAAAAPSRRRGRGGEDGGKRRRKRRKYSPVLHDDGDAAAEHDTADGLSDDARPAAAAAAAPRPRARAPAGGDDFSDDDDMPMAAARPRVRARAARAAGGDDFSDDGMPMAAARPRARPARVAGGDDEDEDYGYYSEDGYSPAASGLDPDAAEFPKLVDPPFDSKVCEPLQLKPSDKPPPAQAQDAEPQEDAEALEVPGAAARYLRDYQKDGIRFLYNQYVRGLGGVLGDDMGLGKTVMVVNFLSAVLKKTCRPADRMSCGAHDGRCCLIVAPTSVMHQWEREFRNWVFAVVATIHKGTDVEPVLRKCRAKTVEVVIVGHDRFRLSADQICGFDWHLAVFDEAHKLKDPKAKLYAAAAGLKTSRRYGLTGTPVQNSMNELYSLLDLMTPGCMGEKTSFTVRCHRPSLPSGLHSS